MTPEDAKRYNANRYNEGRAAAERFDLTMNRLLGVSKEELNKREAAYKRAREERKARHKRARAR